jgi:two-component system chemotaxis response regulator CheB
MAMKNRGLTTIAQDEPSSVVWGMPGAAVKIDAAMLIQPLESIPDAINKLFANRAINLNPR